MTRPPDLHPAFDPETWSLDHAESVYESHRPEDQALDDLAARIDGLYALHFTVRDAIVDLHRKLDLIMRFLGGER